MMLPCALWEKTWHLGIFFFHAVDFNCDPNCLQHTTFWQNQYYTSSKAASFEYTHFTPCFLWSESVMSWQIWCVSLLPRVISHRKKAKHKIIYQKKKATWQVSPVNWPQITSFLFLLHGRESKEFVVFRNMSHCSKWIGRNLPPLKTAAIIWAKYQAKIIEQNGTFESTSRQMMVLMPCREDTRSPAGFWGWFTPVQRHAHCARVGLRRSPLQRGLRKDVFFGAHLSEIAAIHAGPNKPLEFNWSDLNNVKTPLAVEMLVLNQLIGLGFRQRC